MYVKDSVIEKQIEKDLQVQRLKGKIEGIEYQLNVLKEGTQRSRLTEEAEKLRGELKLLLKE